MEPKNVIISNLTCHGVPLGGTPQQPPAAADSIDAKIAAEEMAVATTSSGTRTFAVRGLVGNLLADVNPVEIIWNGMPYVENGLIEVIGAPGVGKSRFMSSLARAQVLGREFGGLPTLNTPKRWLFVGSENGVRRHQREAQKFILGSYKGNLSHWTRDELYEAAAGNGFTREEVDQLDANFLTFTLEDPEDCIISLHEENCLKLIATLKQWRPEVLVCDPWGDVIDGDELKDADIRTTIRSLRTCLATAGLKIPVIVVNHSRMGARELAAASGLDAGNFGKNSKCLYSIARYVLNIRPASRDKNPPIEVICAKNNDGRIPPPVAFKLNDTTEMYELLKDFDHVAWQKELEGDARGGHKTSKMTTEERDNFVRRVRKEVLETNGEAPFTETRLTRAVKTFLPALTGKDVDIIVASVAGEAPGTQALAKELGTGFLISGFPRGKYIGTLAQLEWAKKNLVKANAKPRK